MYEWEVRNLLCEIGRRIWQRGCVAANDGNFSYRLSENVVLATPTLISKGFMRPEDLVKIDMEGNQLEGKLKVTSEIKMHLTIYKERPDFKAVVHAHPPHATAYAITGEPLPKCILPEVEIVIGTIPITEYGTPGTKELSEAVQPFARNHSVLILSNHGVVTADVDIMKAYYKMEMIEQYCRILILAKQVGNCKQLNPEQMKKLYAIKEKMELKDSKAPCDTCKACPGLSSVRTSTMPSIDKDLIEKITKEVLNKLGN